MHAFLSSCGHATHVRARARRAGPHGAAVELPGPGRHGVGARRAADEQRVRAVAVRGHSAMCLSITVWPRRYHARCLDALLKHVSATGTGVYRSHVFVCRYSARARIAGLLVCARVCSCVYVCDNASLRVIYTLGTCQANSTATAGPRRSTSLASATAAASTRASSLRSRACARWPVCA